MGGFETATNKKFGVGDFWRDRKAEKWGFIFRVSEIFEVFGYPTWNFYSE